LPAKDFRAFYRGLGDALAELYHDGILTLAAGENGAEPGFDGAVFERACAWIRGRGKFTPAMMKEKPARELTAETFRILDGAITLNVSEEMPDDLVGLLENNAFIFSGLKTFHSLSEVGLSLVDKAGGIKPFEKFREDVARIDAKYNRNYLHAEYNHAVASSQMASKWNGFEQDGDRYDLQYRTAGDGLVRAEHALLHNTTLPPGDPFWDQFTPPNGWNCRCTVVQVPKGKYPTGESSEAIGLGEQATAGDKGKIFRFNPGREMKVFPDKHPYNKAPQEARDMVQELTREREAGLRKQTDTKVKEWAQKSFRGKPSVTSTVFETGEVRISSKSIRNYLGHARTNEAKWMLKNALDRPETMKHVGFSPLGATKDMGNPVHVKNVAAKAKRHVTGYNLYEFKYRNETWLFGFEKIMQGEKAFEQPYYVKKKKS
jgi:SPP1 gp7 family putative phage head morphogenesis protein